MLRIGTFAGSVLVGLAFLVFAQEALPKKEVKGKTSGPALRSEAARKALAEPIEIPEEFRKPGQSASFRTILAYIDDKLSARNLPLPIVVEHRSSFKDAISGDPFDIYESQIEFPQTLRTATVQEIIEHSLNQVPNVGATYLVRNGRVDIVTHQAAGIQALLDGGVAIQLRDVPLKFAIEDLADLRGFSVMIDPRCGDALTTPVSLQTQNDTSARGILSAWADMFNLTLVVNEHVALLMPRAEYIKKLKDQVEETQLLRKMNENVNIEPPTPTFNWQRLQKGPSANVAP